ncbi:MAG: CotH kinase family protein [Akkermansiaceae bacterium]
MSFWRFPPLLFGLVGALSGELVITEFLGSNETGIVDEDGEFSDWVEIFNPDGVVYDLGDYALTDEAGDLLGWSFPSGTLIQPGSYRVVFASNKDRLGSELHTNFKLAKEGGVLGLTKGGILVSGFDYPAQTTDQSFGISVGGQIAFFTSPTPGLVNGVGVLAGPVFDEVSPEPVQPFAGALEVMARSRALNGSVSGVKVFYREGFGSEVELAAVELGGGIYSATIPASAFGPGVMTRWRFEVSDSNGLVTTSPAFDDPENAPKYCGTVGADPSIESNLTTLHWFIEDPEAAGMRFDTGDRGAPGALYYRGQFYDNVGFKLHGQSTSTFPKKSYNIDFNKGQKFEWSAEAPRVSDIDLLTNWADKSKIRHAMSYEVMRGAGVAAHFAYTVRVHQNGAFFSTADLVEDADESYLERAGLNPEGVLYKAYDMGLNKDQGDTAEVGMQKKTRKEEDNSDLQSLIDGLDLQGASLENYLYDNIDLPSTINYLATLPVIRNVDLQRKNWYLYRDTGESDEWAMLPWDLDLSQGREFNQVDKYFDNNLLTEDKIFVGGAIRLITLIRSNPKMKEMLMRRMRTLHDRFLQEESTPLEERYFERRLDELLALIDDPTHVKSDAQLDFEKWGSWLSGEGGVQVPYTLNDPDVETMAEAVGRYKSEFLAGRRDEIYERQIVGKGGEIPLPQKELAPGSSEDLVTRQSVSRYLVPTDGSAGLSWTGGSEPFDDASWSSGTAAIGYDLGFGYNDIISTDVRSAMWTKNASLYLRVSFEVADTDALEGLELKMQYDDGFVVYLNGVVVQEVNAPESPSFDSVSNGTHEANAALYDSFDLASSIGLLQNGTNVLAIHGFNQSKNNDDFVMTVQLLGNLPEASEGVNPQLVIEAVEASPASGLQDEEFIKITNPHAKAIDVSDWTLSSAVDHQFKPGTVIPANGSLYVSPRVRAFRARATSPKAGEGLFLQGGYSGHLSNLGETIVMRDDEGVFNADFSYPGDASDAQLYLVISELMYHPEPDGDAEFIELLNTSETTALDLTGIRFTSGVEFDFTGSAVTSLLPGERVLVVRNISAFEAVHGVGLPIAGLFQNDTKLSNSNDLVKLEDALNNTIAEFRYRDDQGWPMAADQGYSLVLVDQDDLEEPTSWRSSAFLGGAPGLGDSRPLPSNLPEGLFDYVLGNDLGLPVIQPSISQESHVIDGVATMLPTLTFTRSLAADGAVLGVELSSDLVTWGEDSRVTLESEMPLGDGRSLVTMVVMPPVDLGASLFYRITATVK